MAEKTASANTGRNRRIAEVTPAAFARRVPETEPASLTKSSVYRRSVTRRVRVYAP
jgi:hypothetical protein